MAHRRSHVSLLSENERLRRALENLVLKEKIGIDELMRMCREKGELVEN